MSTNAGQNRSGHYVYGEGSMGWEPEPEFTHLQVVRNEITKALYGENADLALVAQFLDEIAVHGYRPQPEPGEAVRDEHEQEA